MSRFVIILILSAVISYGIISSTQNRSVLSATENSVDNYTSTKLRNIANSTIQMLMSKVADDINWRTGSMIKTDMLDGNVSYTVTNANLDGEDLIRFYVKADYNGDEKEITAYAIPMEPHPTGVIAPAAITANNNILTLGNITIDGRDHTKDGKTIIAGEGTYGIWTTKTFTNSGASDIGGTNTLKKDFKPTKTPDPSIIAQNQSWPGGTPPTTPEQVLKNLPFTISLKEYAKSGDWGSQYVTDPEKLRYPLKGVTYVEPNGGAWISANIQGSGILIVHNDQVNALLKNTQGNFTGIVIADDVVHLQSDIIGAVVSLTQNPSEGNTIGLSTGFILYSKEALAECLMTVRPRNYGFASNRLLIRHWYE